MIRERGVFVPNLVIRALATLTDVYGSVQRELKHCITLSDACSLIRSDVRVRKAR